MNPSAEEARLISLEAHQILDTAPEQEFDSIVRLASQIAATPIALVSLVDECRQWFKARHGLEVPETPRDEAFCAVAIRKPDTPTIVPDATLDPRFRTNPLVVGEPHIRFYAGVPICDDEGRALGTLCVIDRVRRELDDEQRTALAHLASLVEQLLRSRLALMTLDAARRRSALFEAGFDSTLVGMQVLTPDGTFLRVNRAFAEMVGRSADGLVGTNWRDLTYASDRHDDRRVLEELTAGRRAEYRELKRYVRPDGTVVWGDMNVTAVLPDGVDRPETMVHLTQVIDVTERMEAPEPERAAGRRLEESERRYRSLVEPAPDAVIRCTAGGSIADANRIAGSMMGYDDLEGRHLDEILPRPLSEELAERLDRVVRSGRAETLWRQWFEPADREPGWYVVRIVPEIEDDSPEP